MDQVRVNLTLEREIWEKFTQIVPKREKSRIINTLLKQEIAQRERRLEAQHPVGTLDFQGSERQPSVS